VRAIDSAVNDTIKLREVEIRKYKFIERGLYVKYKYQRAVWSKTIPPSEPVTGITVFTRSLLVSLLPTSWDKK